MLSDLILFRVKISNVKGGTINPHLFKLKTNKMFFFFLNLWINFANLTIDGMYYVKWIMFDAESRFCRRCETICNEVFNTLDYRNHSSVSWFSSFSILFRFNAAFLDASGQPPKIQFTARSRAGFNRSGSLKISSWFFVRWIIILFVEFSSNLLLSYDFFLFLIISQDFEDYLIFFFSLVNFQISFISSLMKTLFNNVLCICRAQISFLSMKYWTG